MNGKMSYHLVVKEKNHRRVKMEAARRGLKVGELADILIEKYLPEEERDYVD